MGVDDDERLPACRNSYMLTTALIPFRKPETCDVQSSQAQPAVEEQVQFFQLGAGFSIPLELITWRLDANKMIKDRCSSEY
jgi:hypothetical protein